LTVDVGSLLFELFDLQSPLLFLRSVYPKLHGSFPFGEIGRSAVIGTPGIAKSTFLLYVLLRRVKDGHPTCFHQLSTQRTWLFQDGSCTLHDRSSRLPIELERNKQYIVLLDKVQDNPTNFPKTGGMSILAFSPMHANYHQWEKDNSRGRRYMPLWTLAELQRYRELVRPDVSESLVAQRFALVGGIFPVG
jgi:hypothetical protein